MIRHTRKPHAARKIHGSMLYRTGVIADRSFTLREWEFSTYLFGCCDLDLDPMTFMYELDPYSVRYIACAKMNFLRPLFRKLSSDIRYMQTDIQTGSKLYEPSQFISAHVDSKLRPIANFADASRPFISKRVFTL